MFLMLLVWCGRFAHAHKRVLKTLEAGVERHETDGAILRVLAERGPLPAGELAKAVVEALGEGPVSYPEVKSAVWRLVDERRCNWNFDHRIALSQDQVAAGV